MMEYVLSYIVILINIFTSIFLYKIITKGKITITKSNFGLFLLICLLLLFLRIFNRIDLNIITNVLFLVILLKMFYRDSIKKCIYYTIVISIISLFSDAIVSFFLSNSFISNYKNYQTNFYVRSLVTIPLSIIEVIVTFIPFLKVIINSFYDYFLERIHFNKINIAFFLSVLTLIFMFFCLNAYDSSTKIGHLLVLLSILSFTILFMITLRLMYKEYQINQVNKLIISENKYIKEIAKNEEIFKHNIINNLLGIKTVANKKTSELIDVLISDYQNEYKTITNINDLPDGIQSIIYRKAYQRSIDNLNLVVDNSITNDLYNILSAKKYNHFCTAIGILFDNALQAVADNDKKIITIEFVEDKEYVYFILKNSFDNVIDIENIGKKNYTSKKDGHGIGINYILKLKSLNLKNEIINDFYVSKLRIKKQKI